MEASGRVTSGPPQTLLCRVGQGFAPLQPDTLFDELRKHFDDAQLVELTHHIALENMRGRFNLALGVGSAGFSEGMVCAMPASVETLA